MIEVGVIGGAGYAGGELLRILHRHPQAQISYVHSQSQAGKPLGAVHGDMFTHNTCFSDSHSYDVDVVFLCGGHGNSKTFLEANPAPEDVRVIDLSADFRLSDKFVYGLPEINADRYNGRIANPGCFATAIQLALLPLAEEQLLFNSVHVHAITGSTGAGQTPTATSHFAWRTGNLSVYKPFVHQHLEEIKSTLEGLQQSEVKINMIPMRGPFARGIFASIYTYIDMSLTDILDLYNEYYNTAVFTHCVDRTVELKQVVSTNYCLIGMHRYEDKLLLTSAIDNLIKGAAGQAVQNMNILFGLNEQAGLDLKPSVF